MNIDRETRLRASGMAETMEESSRGVITEKQAFCYILYHGGGEGRVPFIEENYTAEDIADVMGCSESNVHNHLQSARKNLVGAKILVEIVEETPWWATMTRVEEDESDK